MTPVASTPTAARGGTASALATDRSASADSRSACAGGTASTPRVPRRTAVRVAAYWAPSARTSSGDGANDDAEVWTPSATPMPAAITAALTRYPATAPTAMPRTARRRMSRDARARSADADEPSSRRSAISWTRPVSTTSAAPETTTPVTVIATTRNTVDRTPRTSCAVSPAPKTLAPTAPPIAPTCVTIATPCAAPRADTRVTTRSDRRWVVDSTRPSWSPPKRRALPARRFRGGVMLRPRRAGAVTAGPRPCAAGRAAPVRRRGRARGRRATPRRRRGSP